MWIDQWSINWMYCMTLMRHCGQVTNKVWKWKHLQCTMVQNVLLESHFYLLIFAQSLQRIQTKCSKMIIFTSYLITFVVSIIFESKLVMTCNWLKPWTKLTSPSYIISICDTHGITLNNKNYRVCHGFRLLKQDDYFRVNFDHFWINCCF